jgi:hypothetical protein
MKPTYPKYHPSDVGIRANRAYSSVIGTLAFILWMYLIYDKERLNVKWFMQRKYLRELSDNYVE